MPRIDNWNDVDRLSADPRQSVPEHRREEFQNLCRLLRFRPNIGLPLNIEMHERPDCIITTLRTGKTTGIEVARAANPSWEEAEAYLRNTKKPEYDQISRNWFHHPGRKGKALGQYIKAMQSASPDWHPQEQVAAKSDEVVCAIHKKTTSMNSPTYCMCHGNWLLIVDKLPFILMNTKEFAKSVRERLLCMRIQHHALYFVTQLHNRAQKRNEDVLYQLSATDCQLTGHLPSR